MFLRAAILLLSAAAVCPAADETRPSDAPPAPLDAAKREYAELKASRLSAGQDKAGLPGTATPELHLSAEPTLTLPSGAGSRGQRNPTGSHPSTGFGAARSKNWLVEAMNAATPKAKAGASGDRAEDAGADPAEEAGPASLGEGAAKEERAPKEETARLGHPEMRVENPLAGFLASWMTPGDYKLLKSASDSGTGIERLGTMPTDGLRAPPSASRSIDQPALAPVSVLTPGAGSVAANPYLQPTSAPSADFALGPRPGPTPPAAPPPARLAPVAPAGPTPTKPTEVFKPSDNDKFFPQMKRF